MYACLRKNRLSAGLGSHTPGSGPQCNFSSDTPVLFQTLCVCNLTSTSRETPFSTAADETGHDWGKQSLITRGDFIVIVCQNTLLTVLISDPSSKTSLRNPLFLPTGNPHKHSVLAMLQQEYKYLKGFIFFESLCIGLFLAPNIIYWNALYLTKLVFHSLSSVKNTHVTNPIQSNPTNSS